jgi:ferredoxin
MQNYAQTVARAEIQESREELLKIRIEEGNCIGCGICGLVCPDVFKLDGKKVVVDTGPMTEDNAHDCRIAARDCPMDALVID